MHDLSPNNHCRQITGNGYIEGSELDNFLRDFVGSIRDDKVSISSISLYKSETLKSHQIADRFDVSHLTSELHQVAIGQRR